ncbi:MAG: glycosyltransferase family 39 protein [Deltaproteobacteria bacterium]|nr:glycosyltransferase family 39 protein [Candidatus Anaeroferrophillacea bacterium]
MNNHVHYQSLLGEYRDLAAILLLSTVLKLLLLVTAGAVNPDAAAYIAAAERFAGGHFDAGLELYYLPFYPLLLAAAHVLIPDWITAGRLLSFLPLVLAAIPLYHLTRRLGDRRAALATTLLFAILPVFNLACREIIRDPLFLLLILCAMERATAMVEHYRPGALVAFFALSLAATLIRIEGVMIPAVFLGWWLAGKNRQHKRIVTVSLLAVTPAALLAAFLTGTLLGIERLTDIGLLAAWLRDDVGLRFLNRFAALMRELEAFQYTLPGGRLHNNLVETTRHWAPLVYAVGLLEMMVIGIFPTTVLGFFARSPQTLRRRHPGFGLLCTLLASTLFATLLFNILRNFTTERYLWMPIVLGLPFAGTGLDAWWKKWRRQGSVLAAAVVLLMIVTPLGKTLAKTTVYRETALLRAGDWLREYRREHGGITLYTDRRLPLHAGRPADTGRVLPWPQVAAAAGEWPGVDLVAVDLRPADGNLNHLTLDGFKALETFQDRDKAVIIFRRMGTAPGSIRQDKPSSSVNPRE